MVIKNQLSKIVGFLLLFYCCTARPTSKDEHVTMSGEPTHFQVDDKAAELEINANAMGVKVNAKPASLQVVSKPGAPSIPIAHPAVVVPQLPPPYLPMPFYPSPGIIGHRRTVRKRHHFFNMDPGMGNWNVKKHNVPRKRNGNKISKKSEIASKKSEVPSKKSEVPSKKSEVPSKNQKRSKKRQWIQQLPVIKQLVPYPQMTNIRVHPLVQQMAAQTQSAARGSIPRSLYDQTSQSQPNLEPMYTYGQGYPYMALTANLEQSGQARSLVNHGMFVPPYLNQQIYTPPSPTATFMPMLNQGSPYTSSPAAAAMMHAPMSGFNGYYDPIISRDFVPDLGIPGMPHIMAPTPRAFIPGGLPVGMPYPGYTPLGVWQRVSKRLTIPRGPTTKNTPGTKKMSLRDDGKENIKETKQPAKDLPEKFRERRFIKPQNNMRITSAKQGESYHDNKENVGKRELIVTRPVIPQATQFVTYVPVVPRPQVQAPLQVVPSPQIQAPRMQAVPTTMAERRNLVLNLPSKTSGTFVLNVPSGSRVPQMYSGNPSGPMVGYFYNPVMNSGVLTNQRNTAAAMGLQRSGIEMQTESSNRVPVAELAGIQGRPIVENNHHTTMLYNNEKWPYQVADQLFGGASLQGRTTIPRRRSRFGQKHSKWLDELERDDEHPEDSDYQPSSYNDESPSLSERVDDEGSYTQRVLPDGRTMLRKDQVGFGPITVQAKTAESASRDKDDVTDMDLDSDKRKQIPRPKAHGSYLDKRLGIPKPEEQE